MKAGGEKLHSCHQSGLCFAFSIYQSGSLVGEALVKCETPTPIAAYQKASLTKRSRRSRPAGGAAPPRSPPPNRGPAPPREGVESVTCSGGGGGPAPLGSCVLRLPAPDCPLLRPQSLPPCLRGQGCRGHGERSSRGPRLLRAGNGAPELQRRWEHGARCGRWALLSLLLPPAVAGPRHQEPPTASRRLGLGARDSGGTLRRGGGGAGRGAAADGTPWGPRRTGGKAAGP